MADNKPMKPIKVKPMGPYNYAITVTEIAHHKNGIWGKSFYAVNFTTGKGKSKQNMLAVVFDKRGVTDEDWVAVFDVNMLATGDIKFGSNSWPGDHYSEALYQAIEIWERDNRPGGN